eukprot:6139535-Pleurochrysis_carterae.AAC.6
MQRAKVAAENSNTLSLGLGGRCQRTASRLAVLRAQIKRFSAQGELLPTLSNRGKPPDGKTP